MVAASLAGTALAAETRGLKWEQVGDEWKVTGYEGTATKVEIPSTHEGKPVTQIGKNAFAMSGITSVDIPGSIKSIDEQAFASCAKLTTVTFHDSSEEGSAAPGSTVIGESAFFNCGITTLNLSNSVKSIGENAFANCKMYFGQHGVHRRRRFLGLRESEQGRDFRQRFAGNRRAGRLPRRWKAERAPLPGDGYLYGRPGREPVEGRQRPYGQYCKRGSARHMPKSGQY